jgi:hypothetical protein
MLFEVRVKNSQDVLEIYAICDEQKLMFLAYDKLEQKWSKVLADNCVPV